MTRADAAIARVDAACYRVPVDVPLLERPMVRPFVLVTLETAGGVVGHGLTSGTPHLIASIRDFVNLEAGPAIVGDSVYDTERLWAKLARRFNKRELTGVWSSGVSGVDIAAWDAKGQLLGLPVATLLGGAFDRVPAYVTFGLAEYTTEELAELAKRFTAEGFDTIKMVVGAGGDRHSERQTRWTTAWREGPPRLFQYRSTVDHDVERIAAVRAAVGPGVEIMIDANCNLTLADAQRLCARLADLDIAWFEEPIIGNDPRLLRQLRETTTIPIAAGQNLGHVWDHRRLIEAAAVDICQPNVCFVGGYTEGLRVAALARAFHLPIANGAGWPHHNLALHAAVSNGGPVEFHWSAWKAGELVFDHPPAPEGSWVKVPDAPGLGFSPLPDVLQEYAVDH